jgi:hypothetical protein
VSNFWEVDERDVAVFRVGMILNMLTEYTLKYNSSAQVLLREGQRIAGDRSHTGATHPLLKLIVLDILGDLGPETSGVRLRSAAMFLAVGICIRSSDGRSKMLQLVMRQLRTYLAALKREAAVGITRPLGSGPLLTVQDSEVRSCHLLLPPLVSVDCLAAI